MEVCAPGGYNKSKLQKKEYSVKLTEVFPVTSTIHLSENYARGLDSSDDEEPNVNSTEQLAAVSNIVDQSVFTQPEQRITTEPVVDDAVNTINNNTKIQ